MRTLLSYAFSVASLTLLAPFVLTGCHNVPRSSGTAMPREHRVDHAPEDCHLCDVYYEAHRRVIRIRTSRSQGAGIVVSRTGRILTSAHLVPQDHELLLVESFDGGLFSAKVVRADRRQDLALLQVEAPLASWVPISVERAELPRVGSEVYVIGHPVTMGWTITRGIISGHRKPGEIARTAMLQTDAAISPGNSGGPLLDRKGRLVGLVSSKVVGRGADNVAFATPASVIVEFLGEKPSPRPSS